MLSPLEVLAEGHAGVEVSSIGAWGCKNVAICIKKTRFCENITMKISKLVFTIWWWWGALVAVAAVEGLVDVSIASGGWVSKQT